MRFILDAHRFLFSFNYRDINWRSPKTYGVITLIVLAIGSLVWAFSGDEAENNIAAGKRQVTVASVSELMGGGASLSTTATIQSVSEAKITTEMGGRIVRVQASLGSRVGAGQVLAEIENASQRAAVLQAEGVYEAAKASLRKIQGGTREQQLAVLQTANESAKSSAVSTLLSAYAGVDSAVNDMADQMFTGIELGSIQFTVETSNQQREADLESRRGALIPVLNRQSSASKTISTSSDLEGELDKTEKEVRDTRTFVDVLLAALADAIPTDDVSASDIASYKASATASRTALTSLLSSISTARSGIETAAKNLEQGVEGAVSEDVAATQASVKQAQGAYNGALAALEKTIIRTPISGTLNHFTVKLGDTVSAQQQVAIVSNNNALEAVLYVSEEDKHRISVGQKVTFEDNSTGTVTKIAPALDPVTRRIEVRVGLPANTTLTNGQSIRVTLEKGALPEHIVKGPLAIPITALRMESDRTLVFSVENNVLVAHEVKIGKLSGDSVQVLEGLLLETEIVVDARGLKDGEEVDVAN